MAIFAIIPQPNINTHNLSAAVSAVYRDAHYALDGGAGWLISAKATAKDVSDKLQITDGTSGAALIIEMASYFGRANPAIWTWIKNNLEAKDG
jgi:hypothetical protein